MTYFELLSKANKLLDKGEITIGQRDEMTKPLWDEIRPKGEWREVTKGIDSNTYECPFCGRLINCDRPRLKLYPFCHCGADMRGAK